MVKTVFETESLLAESESFLKYCEAIVHYAMAEKFYIFTCLNHIQSADPKRFYRERAFNTLLRFFFFLADFKEQLEMRSFGTAINQESLEQLQMFLNINLKVLFTSLEPYQFVNPSIILIVERTKQMVEIIQEREPSSESLINSLKKQLQKIQIESYNQATQQIANAVTEISNMFKEKSQSKSDLTDEQQFSTSPSQQLQASLRKQNKRLSRQVSANIPLPPSQHIFKLFVQQNTAPFSHAISTKTEELQRQTTGAPLNIRNLLTGKDQDQNSMAKSILENRTRMMVNDKKNQLIINKNNIVTEQEEINEQIKDDQDIDLEKIKKYFENVINEKHFLANYGRAKQVNGDGKLIDETEIREQKQESVSVAKKYFQMGMKGQIDNNSLIEMRQKTRLCNIDMNQLQQQQKAEQQRFKESQEDPLKQIRRADFASSFRHQSDGHMSISDLINQNVNREKRGIVKEHQMMGIYKHDFSEEQNKSQERISTEIMDIPEYKNSPFYPLKKDLKKLEKEKSKKMSDIDVIYNSLKQHFTDRLVELGVNFQAKDKAGYKYFIQQFREKEQTSEDDKTMSQDELMNKLPTSKRGSKKKPRNNTRVMSPRGKDQERKQLEGQGDVSPNRYRESKLIKLNEPSDDSIFGGDIVREILDMPNKLGNSNQYSGMLNKQYTRADYSRTSQALDEPMQQAQNNSDSQQNKVSQYQFQWSQALNKDQISTLKNHDKISKGVPLMRNQAYQNQVTAINAEAADRRPIKMRDFGVLKSYLNQNAISF